MNGIERTLLSFLETPVVIGDPAGCAVWANPAFEERFDLTEDDIRARPLAELFSGGSRERVLHAVAMVSEAGESQTFRLREHGSDYEAVVSGIEVGAECVGVVILLKETLEQLERLCSLQRQLREPLDEIEVVLDALLEQTGGRRSERHRQKIEDAIRCLERVRKWSEELGQMLAGGGSMPGERFDPMTSLRRVVNRGSGGDAHIELVAPATLPALEGDPNRFEWAMSRMLEERASSGAGRLLVASRVLESGTGVLVSICEIGDEAAPRPAVDPPEVLSALDEFGARVHTVADPKLGRATLVRLPLA